MNLDKIQHGDRGNMRHDFFRYNSSVLQFFSCGMVIGIKNKQTKNKKTCKTLIINNKRRIMLITQYYCNRFYLNTKITAYGRQNQSTFLADVIQLVTQNGGNKRYNYFSHDATAFTPRNLHSLILLVRGGSAFVLSPVDPFLFQNIACMIYDLKIANSVNPLIEGNGCRFINMQTL